MQGEKRLFTAIELPNSWRDAVSNTERALKNKGVQGRFVPVGRLHLTVNFIGETMLEAGIIEEMSRIQHPLRIDLSAGEGDLFRRRQGGDLIVWHVNCDRGLELYRKAESAALSGLGLSMERRPYRPHLTLARKVKGSFLNSSEFPSVFIKPEPFSVSEIVLFCSRLVDGKRIYTPVHRISINKDPLSP